MKEFYFTIFLTENEHAIVKKMMEDYCKDKSNGVELYYYRKFKEGHVPGYREVKVVGNIKKFKLFLMSEKRRALWLHVARCSS